MVSLRVENWTSVLPVSLDTFKAHRRITVSTQDTLLTSYLMAATKTVETYLGRSLINKSFVQSHDFFPHSNYRSGDYEGNYRGRDRRKAHPLEMKLLRSPLRKVSKIVYTDVTGVARTLVPQIDDTWSPQVVWYVGDQIVDSNLNIQEVTAVAGHADGSPNLSGASAPTWATSATTTDGDITWTYKSAAPTPSGDFRVYKGEPARVLPLVNACWPYAQCDALKAVEIFYVSGYGLDGNYVNPQWSTAILLQASNYDEFREPVSELPLKELPMHLKSLLEQDRIKDYNPTDG